MPITQQELARRLRAARDACGLTQEDVAAQLGVSRPTIAQIELGNRAVSSLELDRLAYLYGRDLRALLAEDFRAEDSLIALFRLSPDATQEEEVRTALRDSLVLGRELTKLERLLGIERERAALPLYPVPQPKKKWEAVQQGELTAIEERRRLQLGDAPLPDLAELLESQGVRTAQRLLPEDLSGLTLVDPEIGPFVVANHCKPGNSRERRRFSYAHEYCHVLLDREQRGIMSWSSDREKFREVRANAFAAAFLMPRSGVTAFVHGLGKGRASRLSADVNFDEQEAQRVQERPEAGTQDIQMHDVVLLAHHFGVSRLAALYRLKNLELITQPRLDALLNHERQGLGKRIRAFLGLEEVDADQSTRESRHRGLALAIEAYRREEISRSKLNELTRIMEATTEDLATILAAEREGGADETGTTLGAE